MAKKKIQFLYYSGTSIVSRLIRARLASIFSHSAIVFEDDGFYHSTMSKGTHLLESGDYGYPPAHITTIEVEQEDYDRALAFVKASVGKRYDFLSLVGFFLVKKFNNKDGYFCSELSREVFEYATGCTLTFYSLVSPGELRLITDTYANK